MAKEELNAAREENEALEAGHFDDAAVKRIAALEEQHGELQRALKSHEELLEKRKKVLSEADKLQQQFNEMQRVLVWLWLAVVAHQQRQGRRQKRRRSGVWPNRLLGRLVRK